MSQTTALAKNPAFVAIETHIEARKSDLVRAMSKRIDPSQFLACTYNSIQRSDILLRCDAGSIYAGMITAAGLGLELNGPRHHCCLVPRDIKDNVTGRYVKVAVFQIEYRGLIELAMRSNVVKTINAHIVYEDDEFSVEHGTSEKIIHKPNMRSARYGMDDAWIAVYCVAIVNGEPVSEAMTRPQVEAWRDRYAKRREGQFTGAWKTHLKEMGLKTVILKVGNKLPLGSEYFHAVASDGDEAVNTIDVQAEVVGDEPAPQMQQQLNTPPVRQSVPMNTTDASNAVAAAKKAPGRPAKTVPATTPAQTQPTQQQTAPTTVPQTAKTSSAPTAKQAEAAIESATPAPITEAMTLDGFAQMSGGAWRATNTTQDRFIVRSSGLAQIVKGLLNKRVDATYITLSDGSFELTNVIASTQTEAPVVHHDHEEEVDEDTGEVFPE